MDMLKISDVSLLILFSFSSWFVAIGEVKVQVCEGSVIIWSTLDGMGEDCVDYFGNTITHGHFYVPGKCHFR